MSAVNRTLAVVPVYNHGAAVGAVVQGLRAHGLPVLLVDDGSAADCAAVLDALAAAEPGQIRVERLPVNQGKGGAMMAGLRRALALGYSHALQIDADGQHDGSDVPRFLALSKAHPSHFICGCPVYDDTVPRARLYGRYATHIWVWINTLSMQLRDSMCGFRVYPLAPTVALIDSVSIGRRMDFDVEIAVRLLWRGLPVINQPTRVSYPSDGISHFRALHDNLLISWMHTRLFFGMLARAPMLLWRRLPR
ncbi:glycosyltransferase family 2 protein [Roseateles oligotrophus]|uniref:Glycosyltransferase family 2 protein n=1 Tax=Roseateles oligotrophus TaxID=1769250 RepID=A0ABT2YDG8_9BURK|nr:glycosyltransferase family 2 protein [Roseateles oligotrophus]MCV2368074.1 glycosyltransferase family 2 protein [Roseateles oligotrophus]